MGGDKMSRAPAPSISRSALMPSYFKSNNQFGIVECLFPALQHKRRLRMSVRSICLIDISVSSLAEERRSLAARR
jgi:hypothetical protein